MAAATGADFGEVACFATVLLDAEHGLQKQLEAALLRGGRLKRLTSVVATLRELRLPVRMGRRGAGGGGGSGVGRRVHTCRAQHRPCHVRAQGGVAGSG